MAPPKKGARRDGKPWRPLAFVLAAIVALAAGMFGTGEMTPRLGIDLAGGTSITLQAKPSSHGDDKSVNSDNMDTALSIINKRVNGFGVSNAEVQKEGDRNIIINIPKGKNEEQTAAKVGKTARLYFRPVLSVQPLGAAGKQKPKQPQAPSTGKGSESGKSKDGAAKGSGPQGSASGDSGKALSKALTADDESGGSGGGKGGQKPTAPPMPGMQQGQQGASQKLPKKLQKRLDNLKCDKKHALKAGKGGPDDSIVACGSKSTGTNAKGTKGEKYALGPVALDGTKVKKAEAGMPEGQGQVGGWQVNLEFNNKGSHEFADVTGKLSKKQDPRNRFAVVLDGQVMSAPSVNESITGGSAQISGSFTQKSANDLADVLKYGALPLSFDQSDVTQVSATLGGHQLEGGLIAGGIGVALIIVYMMAYYRGLGLVAITSLVVSMVLTYAVMCLLGPTMGFALNLPAVCGAIVAIGITADSFIVYFERVRDELRQGRSLRPSVEKAWPKARRTVLVSDFVSFLAAAVLYFVSIGEVKGFAFTLGLTTLLDVVVVFLFTKPLLTLLARRRFFANGHKWSGLDPRNLGARRPPNVRGRLGRTSRTADNDTGTSEARTEKGTT